jgi:hypothetical protein
MRPPQLAASPYKLDSKCLSRTELAKAYLGRRVLVRGTARLPCRRHHKDRQRSPEQPNRRPAAMGLSRCPTLRDVALRTTLRIDAIILFGALLRLLPVEGKISSAKSFEEQQA